MNLTRRALLGTMAASAATAACGFPTLDAQRATRGKRPKNIIFMVADGMPISSVTVVDHLRQIRDGKRSYWAWLYDQPFVFNGLQDTRSLNSVVTDSSSASSAWGCGSWIWNGMTNVLPDKTEMRTLTTLMAEKGVKCGLVTTTTMTHATPSGFAVCSVQRDYEAEIATKYLGSGVDVLLGGGDRFFDATKRPDKRDLYADFAKAGFKVVKNRDDLMASNDPKLLGVFSNSHLPYTLDRNNDPALQKSVPTLAEMSKKALEILKKSGSKNGFLLQIEGGRVDHGNHANDAAASLWDQMAFEDAVQAAIEFAIQDKETLVIITADHACGGLALNGAGAEYIDSTAGMKSILGMKSSFAPLLSAIGTSPDAKKVQDAVEAKLGIQMSTPDAELIVSSLKGQHPFGGSSFFKSVNGTLGMVVGNYSKITFTSGNHHSDHVLVTAFGPGAEHCAGLTQNTEFFKLMTGFKGIKHENPKMDFATAAPLYEKLMRELGASPMAMLEEDLEMDHGYRRFA